MTGSRLLVALLAIAACKSDAKDHSATHTGSSSDADAWAIHESFERDDVPMATRGARHERAERLCPTVTPYFYELAKDGKVSHILGTRHIGVPFRKLPPIVHDDLHTAKLAVFEVAPDDTSHFEPPDEDLRAELGPADWAKFRQLVGHKAAYGLAHVPPERAVLELLIDTEDISAILDKEIENDVAEHHIPAIGLETAEFQDRVLQKLLDVRMLKAVIETTVDRADLDASSAKDLTRYCQGIDHEPGIDPEDRVKMMKAGYTAAELDAQDETLVFARNRDWIPKLEKLFADGDVFVVVGADHLQGARGVIELLKARGFTATRIAK